MRWCRQVRVVLPPVQPYLFGFVHRTNQETDAHRQQLHIRQGDANVARDHQALIKYPIQDVDEIGRAGDCGDSFHIDEATIPAACLTNSSDLLELPTNVKGGANT